MQDENAKIVMNALSTANSVFIKLWLDVKHSAINHYFAFVFETDVFQIPQLHKHFYVSGNVTPVQ
jgi:hypothetical protein